MNPPTITHDIDMILHQSLTSYTSALGLLCSSDGE